MGCAVYASLHMNFYHQIVYAKFNLQIYYPPLFERVVQHYQHGNTNHIRKAMRSFNWENLFPNKNVNYMINIFNETISIVLNHYIAYESIICDDQSPPQINNIRSKMRDSQLFSNVRSNINNIALFKKLQCLHKKLNDLISTTKRQYCTRIFKKLMDPIDIFLNYNSSYYCIPHFSSESSNQLLQ